MDDWPEGAYLTPHDRDLPYEFQADEEADMEDRWAIYADPTKYGTDQGWFAPDQITEVIRYRTAGDAEADLQAVVNNFASAGLVSKEVYPERGYARLTDQRGRLVAVLEIAEIEQAEASHRFMIQKRSGKHPH